MSKSDVLKSAVRGSNDYHSLMRSVVFEIVSQSPAVLQSEIDKFSSPPMSVYTHTFRFQITDRLMVFWTRIEIGACWSCANSLHRFLAKFYEIEYLNLALIEVVPATHKQKFPVINGKQVFWWTCPSCGREEAFDDIPF